MVWPTERYPISSTTYREIDPLLPVSLHNKNDTKPRSQSVCPFWCLSWLTSVRRYPISMTSPRRNNIMVDAIYWVAWGSSQEDICYEVISSCWCFSWRDSFLDWVNRYSGVVILRIVHRICHVWFFWRGVVWGTFYDVGYHSCQSCLIH